MAKHMFRIVFWDVLPCKIIVDRRFRGAYTIIPDDAVRTSEMLIDNYFTQQYIPEDNSEHHTRRHENLKSHKTHGLQKSIFQLLTLK
jgi:hypothetical protein